MDKDIINVAQDSQGSAHDDLEFDDRPIQSSPTRMAVQDPAANTEKAADSSLGGRSGSKVAPFVEGKPPAPRTAL